MHIVPLIVGEERAAMSLCEAALERGVFAQAIRPPTVARGHVAAAPGGDGQPHRRGAARRRAVIGAARARELGLDPATMGSHAAATPLREAEHEAEELDAAAFAQCAPAALARRARAPVSPDGERTVRRRARDRRPPRGLAALAGTGARVMRGLFVTGTGTGVGKTILSAALLAAMAAAGERVRAHKPVVTGLDEPLGDGMAADHELLASVAGMTPEEVAPLRYGPAVSPHLAAALAGETIDPADLSRAPVRREPAWTQARAR